MRSPSLSLDPCLLSELLQLDCSYIQIQVSARNIKYTARLDVYRGKAEIISRRKFYIKIH